MHWGLNTHWRLIRVIKSLFLSEQLVLLEKHAFQELHASQLPLPGVLNLPLSQAVHLLAPELEKRPAGHMTQALLPSCEANPSSQLKQDDAFTEYFPAAQ